MDDRPARGVSCATVTPLRLAAAGLLLPALPAATQTRPLAPFEVTTVPEADPAAEGDEVGLRPDEMERMTVPVVLGGSGPFHFLVDTGSNKTVVSRQLARRLGLAAGRPARLHSMTGISVVPTATVPSLRLSRQQLRIPDAPLLEECNMGAHGILGLDSLRSQRVIFDFRSEVMTIVPTNEAPIAEEKGAIVIRARRRLGHLILADAMADGEPLQVIIDTGAQVSVGNQALRRALSRSGKLSHTGKAELTSVTGGKLAGDQMVLERLKLGDVELHGLAIVFADAHTFPQLGLDRRPALMLGMNAMRAFDLVSIDFGRKRLRLKPNPRGGQRLALRRPVQ